VLWEGVHARLMVAIANQLQPKLDPQYIASIEGRVFIEGAQRRIPDVWIQKVRETDALTTHPDPESDTALIVEVENLEIRETRVEILDAYNELKLAALIEVGSPTNKAAGPGRVSYKAKQEETLARDCHLIEVELLGRGRPVLCVPEWRIKPFKPFDWLCCVSRWPCRNRYELYPRTLRQRLPHSRSRLWTTTLISRSSSRPHLSRFTSTVATGAASATIRNANRVCLPRIRPGPMSQSPSLARRVRISFRGESHFLAVLSVILFPKPASQLR
jgi:Protein of unknown function (DUF4058)